jgi:hypothetical protein
LWHSESAPRYPLPHAPEACMIQSLLPCVASCTEPHLLTFRHRCRRSLFRFVKACL